MLTNAASVLALSTSNRFLRASERMRALVGARPRTEALTPELRALLLQARPIAPSARRCCCSRALRAAYVALGSFASASLISILGAGLAATALHIGFHALAALALAVGFVGARRWSPPARSCSPRRGCRC